MRGVIQVDNFADVNMIIYKGNNAVAICKPDHLGFIGVYFKNIFLCYPVGTHLDIGFLGHKKNDAEEDRLSMIVNKSGFEGTGLRLKNFEKESINKWRNLLQSIENPLVTKRIQ